MHFNINVWTFTQQGIPGFPEVVCFHNKALAKLQMAGLYIDVTSKEIYVQNAGVQSLGLGLGFGFNIAKPTHLLNSARWGYRNKEKAKEKYGKHIIDQSGFLFCIAVKLWKIINRKQSLLPPSQDVFQDQHPLIYHVAVSGRLSCNWMTG